jgi:hypothetical protein
MWSSGLGRWRKVKRIEKKLTALKSNSNTVWFNLQTYIYNIAKNKPKHFRLFISPNTWVKKESTYAYATIGSKETSRKLVTLMK